jgi:Flp pilus assembly protein TadG
MNHPEQARPKLPLWKRPFFRVRTTESGQTLVEFSMVLPIMLVLIFALVDFGRAFHTWLVVTNAAREGARTAAVQTRITESAASLDTSRLTITASNIQGARGETVEIDLAYDFEFVTPLGGLLSVISGGNLSAPAITGQSSMRLE